MKITVQFESMEEYQRYMGQTPAGRSVIEETEKGVKKAEPKITKKVKAPEPEEVPSETEEPKKAEKAEKPSEDQVEELKKAFYDLIHGGKRKEAKAILNEYEVDKLSQLIDDKPELVSDVLAKVKEVG